MGEPSYPVAPASWSDRRNIVFALVKNICVFGHKHLVTPHVELDAGLAEAKSSGKAAFLYCGLHRSLWETTGVITPLYLAGMDLPYPGMGDNLVHGRLAQRMSWMIGSFMVRRPTGRSEVLESARKLRDDVLSLLAHGVDVLLFPEGTRKNIPTRWQYGEFFPAAFDALLEYERNREEILASNPGLEPKETYVVPLNVDYSWIREGKEMVSEKTGSPRTLNVLDSFSMLRPLGDTYLSYGPPMRVADLLDLDRKGLAALSRQRCLDLVKILPVNVVSRAILTLAPAARVSPAELGEAVRRTVDSLAPFANRFRGFSSSDSDAEIVRRAANPDLSFATLVPENEPLYRLYASYIAHCQGMPRA